MSQFYNLLGKSDLEGELTKKWGAANTREVVSVFSKLDIPLPQQGEFIVGRKGFLVFLSRYGVTLRIEDKNDIHVPHPLMLKPIGTLETRKSHIEICPGTRLGVEYEDRRKLMDILKVDGVKMDDDTEFNYGYLPIKTEEFPRGVPVVLDRGALRLEWNKESGLEGAASRRDIRAMKRIYAKLEAEWQNSPYASMQSELYGELITKFKQWSHSGVAAKTDAINSFWSACEASKQSLLDDGWSHIPEIQGFAGLDEGGDESRWKSNMVARTAEKFSARVQATRGAAAHL